MRKALNDLLGKQGAQEASTGIRTAYLTAEDGKGEGGRGCEPEKTLRHKIDQKEGYIYIPDNFARAFHRRSGDEDSATFIAVTHLKGSLQRNQNPMVDLSSNEVLDDFLLSIQNLSRVAMQHDGKGEG